MTQDEIIRMAREGKSVVEQVHAYVSRNDTDFTSESMAKMVCDFIAAEREACAKVCEDEIKSYMSKQYTTDPLGGYRERFAAEQCAAAIRSRCSQGSRSENDA